VTKVLIKVVVMVVVFAVAGLSAGCEKPLFPETQARSPYERYMVLRGHGSPQTERNAYGVTQPALRERLRPLGDR